MPWGGRSVSEMPLQRGRRRSAAMGAWVASARRGCRINRGLQRGHGQRRQFSMDGGGSASGAVSGYDLRWPLATTVAPAPDAVGSPPTRLALRTSSVGSVAPQMKDLRTRQLRRQCLAVFDKVATRFRDHGKSRQCRRGGYCDCICAACGRGLVRLQAWPGPAACLSHAVVAFLGCVINACQTKFIRIINALWAPALGQVAGL